MNRRATLLGMFLFALTASLISLYPQDASAQAKGWSEEKFIQRGSGLASRVSLPAIAADGDNIYIVYRQTDIKLIISRDRGYSWNEPLSLAPQYRVNSAPAIEVVGSKIVVAWPTRVSQGDLSPFQLVSVESSDQGASWSAPKQITNTRNNAFSPRFLVTGNQAYLLWLETPNETLGKVGTAAKMEISPESVESYNVRLDGGGLGATRTQARSIFYLSTYNASSGSFSNASQIDEIASSMLPHIFDIYGPVNNSIYVVANQNQDIKIYRSNDGGGSWQPDFNDRAMFDSRMLQDMQVINGDHVYSWIRREPFSQIPVNFKPGRMEQSLQLTAPQFVRSLPRLDFSDDVYHIVWEAGNQEESWIAYIRTDEVPPTSKIVLPTSPDVVDRTITFGWVGDDNISSPERLVYSYTYSDQWSQIQPETQARVLAPPDGDYIFKVRSEDVAGNIQDPPTEFSFNTFNSAPETKITKSPEPNSVVETRSVTLEFVGDDNNDPPAQLQYAAQADSGDWTEFTQGNRHTFDNLSNGDHVLRIRMRDSRGNIDKTPAEVAVIVRVGLEIVWNVTPIVTTNTDSVAFSWEARDDQGRPVQLQYYYTLDQGPAQELQTQNNLQLQELDEGAHTLTVWGTDPSGDKTPELSHRFVIDRTPPETKAEFNREYATNFPRIHLSATDPVLPDGTNPGTVTRYEYRIGDSEWTPISVTGPYWTLNRRMPFYSLGYVVEIRSIDVAGNVDASPARVDLRIWNRSNPYIFYPIIGLLAILILFLLWKLMGLLFGGRRRSISKSSYSSDIMGETNTGTTSSFSFDDDDDKKKGKDFEDPYS